jgi:hypothetical protein
MPVFYCSISACGFVVILFSAVPGFGSATRVWHDGTPNDGHISIFLTTFLNNSNAVLHSMCP